MSEFSIGALISDSRIAYFLAVLIIVISIALFMMSFEKKKPKAREVVIVAVLIALACVGRAVFFMVPSFKPVAAVVIIAGAACGPQVGFLTGAGSMLISNFIFAQGPWTPWQMFAMGLIGCVAGVLAGKGLIPKGRIGFAVTGFLLTLVIYGGIMNPAALLMSTYEITVSGLAAYYISGFPVDLVHALSTFAFLYFGGEALMVRLERIKKKHGLYTQWV